MLIEAPTHEIAQAALFYAEALQIARCEGVTINILFVEDECDKSEVASTTAGWIEYADNVCDIYIRREYPDPQESQMEILAHEMVHAKQYIRGEMVDVPGKNAVYWKGELMQTTNNPERWSYWESPWELEAFGRQQGLNYMRQVEIMRNSI